MKKIYIYILTILLSTIFTGCIEEDKFDNSPTGNFDALWNIIDSRYCFFEHAHEQFGLDWQQVYNNYRPKALECKNDNELFQVLGEMLGELRDGHVNLSSIYGTSYYWDWKISHPINFSDSLQRNYLGHNFKLTNGIQYNVIGDSIGYAYIGSFENNFGSDNISVMLMNLSHCKGIILDIRNNGGGMLTAAENLAAHFTDRKIHAGYIQHKTGSGHNDFSSPEEIYLEPADGAIWLRPVVILTNRSVYSSANHFVMLLKGLPHIAVLGDKTGGGSGMPLNSTLPNGWTVRFSACPILDKNGQITEFGIEPDIRTDITSEDWNSGRDTMIEAACQLIYAAYIKKSEQQIAF